MVELCKCVKKHNPVPQNHAIHHILPKSWGGPDIATNRVTLCPTGHENVHTLLNAYVRHGGLPPIAELANYNVLTRQLAAQAWAQRPNDHPPYTSQHGAI